MNEPQQRICAYIDQLYNYALNFENKNNSDTDIRLNYKLMNYVIKNAKEEVTKINNNKKLDKQILVNDIVIDLSQIQVKEIDQSKLNRHNEYEFFLPISKTPIFK
jgi:hypothetical protein